MSGGSGPRHRITAWSRLGGYSSIEEVAVTDDVARAPLGSCCAVFGEPVVSTLSGEGRNRDHGAFL